MVIQQPYIFRLLFIIFLIVAAKHGFAQESEEELSAYALELFEQEEFAAASKTYSTLLSIRLESAEYNFRYGACELFNGENKEDALKYLKFASEQETSPALAHFYYGLGLHLNYQFDRAINHYNKYKARAGKKDKEAALVDHYIEQCQQGKQLVSNFTDISVIERSVLPRTDFYRNYDLSEFGGKIMVKPEDFMSEEDKKRDAKFLMYFQQDADLIYYASFSNKNETGKDLYVIQKLPGGDWSEPQRLDNTINTPYDEDFPFIHPEGNVLYFASKGHNSMGGYDIFKSERMGDGSWSAPTNMEFAINTPWDDFMFITDLDETSAWFASNRQTSNTQVTVYRIGIQRIPLDLTLIKGVLETEGSKKAKITVEDMIQEKTVGVYESNGATGEYLMDLKGSGQYKFIVEAEESNAIHTGIVEVPREKGLKQFRQEMTLINIGGKEQLQIVNHFDDQIDGEQLLTADILKKQASLSVNASEQDLKSNLVILDNGNAAKTSSNHDDLDKESKMEKAESAREALKADAQILNKKAAVLFAVAQEKYNSSDPEDLAEASLAVELAGVYKREANNRLTAVDQLDDLLIAMQNANDDSDLYNAKYTQIAATQNNFKPVDKFEAKVSAEFEQRLDPTITAYAGKETEVNDLQADIEGIDEEIAYYNQEIEHTKDDAIKQELETQIEEAEKVRPIKQTALARAQEELSTLAEQKDRAQAYLSVVADLLSQAATGAPESTTEVSNVALNEMQQVMQRKALGNPALMAFLDPKAGEEALAQKLQSSRTSEEEADENQSTASQNDTSEIPNNSEKPASQNIESKLSETQNQDDLNAEIERIEAKPSETDIIEGNLEAYFSGVLAETESNQDPIIVESSKAEIYDQWAENIAIKIDSLERVKANTSDFVSIETLDADIAALQFQKEEKENLAMESYQRVAELSDQAASQPNAQEGAEDGIQQKMDEEIGNINRTNETTPDEVPPIPASLLEEGTLPQGVRELDKQYTEELSALAASMQNDDPVAYKVARANALEDWANDLQKELDILAAQAKSTSSLEEQRIIEKKAVEVGELRLAKMKEVTALTKEVQREQDEQQQALASKDLQEQLSAYVEVYNASAFQQINEQIRMIPDTTQRKAQLETLYKNWAIGIQNEKVKTEARMRNTTDPNRMGEFQNKLAALNQANERIGYVLDSLETPQDLAGPAVPAAVKVQGSERFEGYTPIDAAPIDAMTEKSVSSSSELEDVKDEIIALESSLNNTKKKKERQEIEATIAQRKIERKELAMRSSFYAEAAQKLTAVESQILTMSPDDALPSIAQASFAATLLEEANLATSAANTAMNQAQAIGKRKEREPAVSEAEALQADATILRQKAQLAQSLAEQMASVEQEAVASNFIVLPPYEVVLPATRKTLNPTEQDDIKKTDEFQFYAEEKRRADSIRQVSQKLEAQELQLNQGAQDFMMRAATAPNESVNGMDKLALTEQAYQQFDEADSLSKVIARMKREATYIENEANRALLTLPQEAYMNVIAYYNTENTGYIPTLVSAEKQGAEAEVATQASDKITDIEPKGTSDQEDQNTVSTIEENDESFALNAPIEERNNSRVDVPKDVLTNTIFELDEGTPKSQYNDGNPIPIDPPMPAGLMYKVQIGAFRNTIRQDQFQGVAPIMGERTASGFIRYTAGEFNNLASAENAKSRIQSLDYTDAFVVAFLNGERISISQANAINNGEQTAIAANVNAANNQTSVSQTNRFIKQGPIEIRSVENIGGSFYTVQVGVYSQPVNASRIFNITPLQQENMPNGLYRYTTGKFDNLNDANQAKDEARALGVVDAFVTAYRNGERVAVAAIAGEPSKVGSIELPATSPSGDTSYRIRLGIFTDRVPVAIASVILGLSSEGIDKVENGDGTRSYYFGDFSSKTQAQAKANELRNAGVVDAVVIER